MTTEALTGQVLSRIRAYQAGNPGPVLAPEALDEAAALLEAVGEQGERGMNGLQTVAAMHWSRYLALPYDRRAEALRTARRLFEPFREYDPGVVPPALRREAGFEDDGATPELGRLMKALRDAVATDNRATLGPLIDDAVALLSDLPSARNGARQLWAILSMAYQQKYIQDKGGPHLLFLEVDAARRGAASGADRPDDPLALEMLASALRFRIARTGDPDDADELAATLRRRLALIPPDDPAGARQRPLFQLAAAFSDRFDRPTAALAVIDDDAVLLREALHRTPPGDDQTSLRLAATGRVLRALYEQTGAEPYLHESVDALRAAATWAAPRDPRRPRYLAEVATSLRLRHTDLGNPADLNEAIDALRAAAQGLSPTEMVYNAGPNPPTAPELWYRIAEALSTRAAHAGDLDEAIAAVTAALKVTPPGPPKDGKPGHDDMQRLYAYVIRLRQQGR
jgi:tetratricopeptide (TPR) repeat protein